MFLRFRIVDWVINEAIVGIALCSYWFVDTILPYSRRQVHREDMSTRIAFMLPLLDVLQVAGDLAWSMGGLLQRAP